MAAFKVNISKSGDAIKFVFIDSNHYLYGDGEIEVPVNSLSLVVDESNMVTFKKAASNDIFLTFDPANSNLSDKAGVINFYKTNMVGSTGGGGGITSGEVQTMIDNSISGLTDEEEVEEIVTSYTYSKEEVDSGFSTVNTAIAGKADTSAVTAVNNALTAHTSDTTIHVTSADKTAWNGKADTSAVTAVNDGLTAHTSDTTIHVTSADKTAWNGKADVSAVTAVQQSLSGKQDTLVSGTNIKTINNESILGSGNITISGGGGQSLVYYTEDTSNESATIMVQNDDGLGNRSENRVFVDGGDIIIESYNETDDGEGNTGTTDTQVDINSLGLSIITSSDDGIDTTQTELEVQPMGAYINSEPIATEPYVDAALSGKADTSAVTAVNNALTAHTADTGIHVSQQEKNAWNAKAEPYSAGTGINITDNVISATGGSSVTIATAITSSSTNTEAAGALATYQAVSGKANVVSLTQAQYDALVSAGTVDSNTVYNITDATAFDPATKQDVLSAGTGIQISSANVISVSGMQETLVSGTNIKTINNESILGSGNITIQGGGGSGATYSAGTNISIDTANTINCTLPITANSATSSTFIAGNPSSVVDENILIGSTSLFRSSYKNNVVIGNVGTKASQDCVVIGRNATGGTNNNYDWYNVAIGSLANANGGNHVAIGYNIQATGTTKMNLNDQIKVDTNNQVYIKDKTNTTDVCIQDAIAALGGLKLVQCTQAEYDALVSGGTVDSSTIYFITNVVS